MPLLAGWVRDSGTSMTQAWLIMSAGVVLLMVIARRFRPQNSIN
jgi:CP family cyanate transporter-like MFS transporter